MALAPSPAPIAEQRRPPSAHLPVLERLLRDVLREQEGEEFPLTLGGLRECASRHDGPGPAEARGAALADLVARVPTRAALAIVRACSMHLALVNLDDELERLARPAGAATRRSRSHSNR